MNSEGNENRFSPLKAPLIAAATILLFCSAWLKADAPPALVVVKTFTPAGVNGVNADGDGPYSRPVRGIDGLLYGMTNGGFNPDDGGGAGGNGVVYQLNLSTRVYKVLHAFGSLDANGFNSDGAVGAYGMTAGPDGALYGQTQAGGVNGNGTVFKITASGEFVLLHTYSALNSDGTNADGAAPLRAIVVGADGNLYGTTRLGGPNAVSGSGLGVAWMMNPSGGSFTVIHAFTSEEGHAASLMQAQDGLFYGCAVWPNTTQGSGSIFRLSPGSYQTIYTFSAVDAEGANSDGANCYEPLLERDGAFFGSTTDGGSNGTGTVFRFSPGMGTGNSYMKRLHTFGKVFGTLGVNADGANPQAPLVVGADGALYSTATFGGRGGNGVVYRLAGTTYTVLHEFSPTDADGVNRDGAYPGFGILAGYDGALVGTTANGGPNGTGTVYELKIGD